MGIAGTNSNFYSNKNIHYPSYNAVQINMSKPTLNAPSGIYNYPDASGVYYPPAQTQTGADIRVAPSGIEDFNNYTEFDKYGNKVAEVLYSKDGNNLVQTLSTKSPDGTMLKKVLKNSQNFKSSEITVTDRDGRVLLSKNKTYQKLDDNNAQTTVNGEVYNISGLKGDVITVEHNGKTVTLDLNKMLNPDVKLLKMNTSPDNFDIRNKKITDEEKEQLFNRIKSLGGDDLFRLSKSVEHLQFLDERSHEAFFTENGKTLLLSPKDWENSHLVTQHELGHAINHSKGLISDDDNYKSVREYEKQNFKQYSDMTAGDKLFGSKFLYGNSDFEWQDRNDDKDGLESNLRDETFAECYNNLNTMDIIHYGDEVLPMRTLSLFKNMPRTMVEVERLSQTL